MKKVELKVEGMTCSACSNGLEKYLLKQKGVLACNVNLILGMVTVEYENLRVLDIEKYISDAGFTSLGEYQFTDDSLLYKRRKRNLLFFGLLLIFFMYLSMGQMLGLPSLFSYYEYPFIYTTILILITFLFIIYGFDILKSGIKNLIHFMPNMDTLVTFSVFFSFIYSIYGVVNIYLGDLSFIHQLYFESVCMVIYFVKVGRYIENVSKSNTTSAIKNLVTITPKMARIKNGDVLVDVTIDEVKEGDLLVVRPNEKFAVDGVVVEGESHVDEAFITGESKALLKKRNDDVLAGSLNYDGVITYKAVKIGKESTVSNIVSMVVSSLGKKNRIERIADKVSGYFVPIIFLIAIISVVVKGGLGYSFSSLFTTFVTVLVVACPCALGLAVPLVISVSYGLCAKRGIVVKEGEALEKVKDVLYAIFDKTGTLTYGKLAISKVFTYSIDKYSLLKIVSSIEANSTHPVASAFSKEDLLPVTSYQELTGFGVMGTVDNEEYSLGNLGMLKKLGVRNYHKKDYEELLKDGCSIIFVVHNKKVVGLIGLKDIVRDDMKVVIAKLRERNITPVMLTGDNMEVAKKVGKELGITEIKANVLPDEKADIVKEYEKQGPTLMIGDGVNDAIALVEASVGISVSSGTDVASDASDVILMNHDLNNLIDLIDIGHKAKTIIVENLFWAFFYNLIMIPIAVGLFENFGIVLNPMIASLCMTLSSLTVVFNSLRLKLIVKSKES